MEKDEIRTGLQVAEIKRDLIDNLFYLLGKFPEVATPNDWYIAVAYTVRDRLLDRWVQSAYHYYEDKTRRVCYLSAEFLIGPQLGMNLLRLNSEKAFRQAVNELGLNLDDLIEHEEEPGLGNGGLGRLAACFMESMATLQVPAIGYGIRYEFGIFEPENITKVLYPNDEPAQGRELRLKQQYFFVSCSLQDMIRLYLQRDQTLDGFPKKFAVQLNDTHPSLAIPELMRLLVDDHLMEWEH